MTTEEKREIRKVLGVLACFLLLVALCAPLIAGTREEEAEIGISLEVLNEISQHGAYVSEGLHDAATGLIHYTVYANEGDRVELQIGEISREELIDSSNFVLMAMPAELLFPHDQPIEGATVGVAPGIRVMTDEGMAITPEVPPVTLEAPALDFSLTLPEPEKTHTYYDHVLYRGNVEFPDAEVLLNGQPLEVSDEGAFSGEHPLPEVGAHTLLFEARRNGYQIARKRVEIERKSEVMRNDKTGFTPFPMEPDAWMDLLREAGEDAGGQPMLEFWAQYGLPTEFYEQEYAQRSAFLSRYVPEKIYEGERRTPRGVIEECVIAPSGAYGTRVYILSKESGREWMLSDYADYGDWFSFDVAYHKVKDGEYETAFIMAEQAGAHGTGISDSLVYWYNLDSCSEALFSYGNSYCRGFFRDPYELTAAFSWKKGGATPILEIEYEIALFLDEAPERYYAEFEVLRARRGVSFRWDRENGRFVLHDEDAECFRRYWDLNGEYLLTGDGQYINSFTPEELSGELHREFTRALRSEDARVRAWAEAQQDPA